MEQKTMIPFVVATVIIATAWGLKQNIYECLLIPANVTPTQTNYILIILTIGVLALATSYVYIPKKKKQPNTQALVLPPPPPEEPRKLFNQHSEEPIITPPEVPKISKQDIEKVFQNDTPPEKKPIQNGNGKGRKLNDVLETLLLQEVAKGNVTINIEADIQNNKAKIKSANIKVNNNSKAQAPPEKTTLTTPTVKPITRGRP